MTNIAIIGNGPSQSDFNAIKSAAWNVKIGCNYPRFDVDYSAFSDAFSARLMRKGASHESKLGDFKIILGERAAQGLMTTKGAPGSLDTCLEYFQSLNLVDSNIVKYEKMIPVAQHFFSSAHLAYFWAVSKYKDADIYIMGCDSVFGRNALESTSNEDVRKKILKEDEVSSGAEWIEMWDFLLDLGLHKKVTFVGQGDFKISSKQNVFHREGK